MSPAPAEIQRFAALSPETGQQELQRRLAAVHLRRGLPAALECLFAWSLASGYMTRAALREVERLRYPDPHTGVTFRLQVNYARSRYSGSAGGGARQGCLLCRENVGRPGRELLRIYEFPLAAFRGGATRPFFLQLTPFPLFSHHFVLILSRHRPQEVDGQSVTDMLDFLLQAPEYTVCSNSDVEWAGSSILEHLHYQVFRRLHLPVMDARAAARRRLGRLLAERLHYPMSAFRLRSAEPPVLQAAAAALIAAWKATDPGRSTVNLVLARRGGEYRLTVLLRHPDHRTPPALRRYKSEGVGVIEAAGEAILPVPVGAESAHMWKTIRDPAAGLALVLDIIRGNAAPLPLEIERGLWSALEAV